MSFIEKTVRFIKEAERLKSVTRTAWTREGRRESTAEHSWRLALLAGLAAERFPELDKARVLMMCLVHDMGELYEGDVSAALLPDPQAKEEAERRAVRRAFAFLPEPQGAALLDLWEEYNAHATPEARLVKALDKAETILQHTQGKNPDGFDYAFNLEYGKTLFGDGGPLSALRKLLDERTVGKIGK